VTSETQAGEASNSQASRYPTWPEIEKALDNEPDLRNEDAFYSRADQSDELNARHRQAIRNSAWVLLIA
jgi:hypothetical protein